MILSDRVEWDKPLNLKAANEIINYGIIYKYSTKQL